MRDLIIRSPVDFVVMCLLGMVFIVCLLYLSVVFSIDRSNKLRCWSSVLFTLGAGLSTGGMFLNLLYDGTPTPHIIIIMNVWWSYVTVSALFWILTVYRLLTWAMKRRPH